MSWFNLAGAAIGGLGGFFGGKSKAKAARKAEERNYQRQKEFAQNSIQWTVADAKKAGINPIFAVGGGAHAFQPVSMETTSPAAEAISGASAGIERALQAPMNGKQRATRIVRKQQELTLENMGLQNDLLRSQIRLANQPGTPPASPVNARWLSGHAGQGDTQALVKDAPLARTAANPVARHSEPGAITDLGYARTVTGGYSPVPSKDMKERLEDNALIEIPWSIRNGLLPMFNPKYFSPPFKAPKGKKWEFSIMRNEYYLVPKKKKKMPKQRHEQIRWR